MIAAPAVVPPRRDRRRLVRQPVAALLAALLLVALFGLPFLSIAPNRLLAGQGVALAGLLHGARLALALPLGWLVVAACLPRRRAIDAAMAFAAALLLAALLALAGAEAADRAAAASPLLRVSLGGGGWLGLLICWLAAADALRRLHLPLPLQALADAAVLAAPAWLLLDGRLDQLSLLKEFANRHDVFVAAFWRHLQIVAASLLPALAVGMPLGIAAARRPGFARPLFTLLNLLQTIPSIALFGLLIGPLAWLGAAWPAAGINGIGLLPAAIALALYALLPIVHGASSGLQQVPAAVLDAAAGIGLSARQRLWRVELPLALPVLLSALRLTTVQLIGLAVVAALIGAGGLGAIVFQGLLGSALDLVLLGVLPTVALALAADASLRLLTQALARTATAR